MPDRMLELALPCLGGLVLIAALAARVDLRDGGGDKTPRLYRVIVPVSDLEKAAKFYGELLQIAGKRVSPGRHYLDCGGVVVALYDPKGDGDAAKVRPLPEHIYFAVADLEAVYERAKRLGGLAKETGDGNLPMGQIAVRPWGERSFYMSDPFGTPLCFVDEKTLFLGR